MVCGTALAVVMVLAVDGTRLDAMVGVGRVWRVWCDTVQGNLQQHSHL